MPEARRHIPVRTFTDWNEPPPGSMQMDAPPVPMPLDHSGEVLVRLLALPLELSSPVREELPRPENLGVSVPTLYGVPSFLLPKVTVGFADNHRVRIGFS